MGNELRYNDENDLDDMDISMFLRRGFYESALRSYGVPVGKQPDETTRALAELEAELPLVLGNLLSADDGISERDDEYVYKRSGLLDLIEKTKSVCERNGVELVLDSRSETCMRTLEERFSEVVKRQKARSGLRGLRLDVFDMNTKILNLLTSEFGRKHPSWYLYRIEKLLIELEDFRVKHGLQVVLEPSLAEAVEARKKEIEDSKKTWLTWAKGLVAETGDVGFSSTYFATNFDRSSYDDYENERISSIMRARGWVLREVACDFERNTLWLIAMMPSCFTGEGTFVELSLMVRFVTEDACASGPHYCLRDLLELLCRFEWTEEDLRDRQRIRHIAVSEQLSENLSKPWASGVRFSTAGSFEYGSQSCDFLCVTTSYRSSESVLNVFSAEEEEGRRIFAEAGSDSALFAMWPIRMFEDVLGIPRVEGPHSSDFDSMGGHEFESFCADLLKKNEFTDIEVTRGSGDQGIDVLAVKDFVKYGFQCKCYSSSVGNKAVQEALAGKNYYGCHVAVVLTNSHFTSAARELAEQTGVVLWDRDRLLSMVG